MLLFLRHDKGNQRQRQQDYAKLKRIKLFAVLLEAGVHHTVVLALHKAKVGRLELAALAVQFEDMRQEIKAERREGLNGAEEVACLARAARKARRRARSILKPSAN